jgi:hypothetical protein
MINHFIICYQRTDESLAQEEVRAEASSNMIRCPKCQFSVTKQSGCNYIVCPNCQFSMCPLCGSFLSPTNKANDMQTHKCNPQNVIDSMFQDRIVKQKSQAARVGAFITVTTPQGEPLSIPFTETDTGATLRAKIAQQTGIAAGSQSLTYAGRLIANETVLGSLQLRRNATLVLTIPVVGGT